MAASTLAAAARRRAFVPRMQRERCQLPTPVALLTPRSRLRAGKSGRAKFYDCGKTGALALRVGRVGGAAVGRKDKCKLKIAEIKIRGIDGAIPNPL